MRDMGWERVACGSLEGVAGERGHKIAARQGRGGLNCNVCSGSYSTLRHGYSLSLQNISNKTGKKKVPNVGFALPATRCTVRSSGATALPAIGVVSVLYSESSVVSIPMEQVRPM